MNDQKFDCQARIQAQPNHGLITDCNSEFAARSSRFFGPHNQPHNMGLYVQQQHQHNHQQQLSMDHSQASLSQLQSLAKHSPSSTIMSRFDSPTSAFYATERCMGFPQYESQVGNYNQFSSGESYSFEASDQTEPGFEFRSSLQTVVKPNNNIPLMFGHDHNKIIHDLDSPNTNINTSTSATSPSIRRQFSINLKENQDIGGYCGSFGSSISQLSFASHHQHKQSPRLSPGNCASISTITNNSAPNGTAISNKTRIRWNQDLHEKFVECINRLGGAEKATPKAILKLMDSDGLTIFHVKSHLQKYRIAKYLPDSAEGKSEKRACVNVAAQLEATAGLQIKEALQIQLDVQRRLHEQLEIQRNLQLQIEEQGKQLKMMFDMQQRTSNSLFTGQSSDISSLDEAPSNSIDETQVSPAEASGNTHFPSKIS